MKTRRARVAVRRAAFGVLRALNARRARRAPAPDTRTVRILLQHAYGMGGTIRTVLNLAGHLARERDVEIVSVVRTARKPFFPIPLGVRVSFLDDRTRRRGPVGWLLSRLPSMLIPRQEKGFDLLVKAWKPVAAAHPDWVLRLYGRGRPEAERRLRARIEEAGLSDTMLLMGSSSEIGMELAKSSIYAVSSRYEGFSMTILEAMSKGVPVVSFDCPHGLGEVIAHEHNGLLVPPKKPAALAEALCRLIEDRRLRGRLGDNAALTAADYNLDAIGARWDALLAELGAGRSGDQKRHLPV
ncbi:glycosyltransferase [Streptosporangium sp. CA-115845]|uniref:glycosyltransferase n=1 Tax=Streptosporangium sp. CA-115845 TaxID=3240071 RepID=UPI003D936C85